MHTPSADRQVARAFPSTPSSPAAARRFATSTVRGWGRDDLAEIVALVVTELATNAVVHARSPFAVTVSQRRDGGVRVSVRDGSEVPPTVAAGADLGETGRGLRLVAAIAARWGHGPVSGGKEVWADVSG